jgi:glycolate oxidase
VPRASIADYLSRVGELAAATGSLVVGCGHVGDGNVHLSVFQGDDDARRQLVHGMVETGVAMGGAVSGEHGLGSEKRDLFVELEDPAKLALLRGIKATFDPAGILNPRLAL